MLFLSEISLFDKEEIHQILPVILFRMHKDIVPRYKNFVVCIDVNENNTHQDIFLKTTEGFGKIKGSFIKFSKLGFDSDNEKL